MRPPRRPAANADASRRKVRIAAHGDMPVLKCVEEVLKGLERRRVKQQISEYAVEVNERAKP